MLKSGEMTEEHLDFKLDIRVYGKQFNPMTSHGYCVDDTPQGPSSPVGTLVIDIRVVTLTQIRPMIQYDRSSHTDRRSIMFQEALFKMSRLPNYFNRPSIELNKYRFGFIKKDGISDFKLVEKEKEDLPISEIIGAVDFFVFDLCIVPLSQIPPDA